MCGGEWEVFINIVFTSKLSAVNVNIKTSAEKGSSSF